MPHCESFYRALDKKLDQKMTINDIAKDLCSHTKDPRRNLILDIKEYKGEDWLIENAGWLGYQVQKKRDVAIEVATDCSNDLARSKANVSDKQEDIKTNSDFEKIKKDKGIIDEMCKCGHLQSQHKDTYLEKGHGPCKFNQPKYDEKSDTFINMGTCSCYRFRWAEFVYVLKFQRYEKILVNDIRVQEYCLKNFVGC